MKNRSKVRIYNRGSTLLIAQSKTENGRSRKAVLCKRFVNFCSVRVCKGIAEKSGFLRGRGSFNSQELSPNDVGRENAGCIPFAPRSVGCHARSRRFWRELEICLVCSPAPTFAHNGTRVRRNSPFCADVRGMLWYTTDPAANRMPNARLLLYRRPS